MLVMSPAPGGSPEFDAAQAVMSSFEQRMKAVIIMGDLAAVSPDRKFRSNGIMLTEPRAGYIVNKSNWGDYMMLLPLDRVIGHPVPGAEGQLPRLLVIIPGQGGQFGESYIREVEIKYEDL